MKFLIFDAYGTLVHLDDFYGRLRDGFASHGVRLPLEVVTRAAHEEMRHYIKNTLSARDEESWQALRRECASILVAAVEKQGHRCEISLEAATLVLSDAVVFRPFGETVEVLRRLRERGVQLAVLSNWDCKLREAFESMGLDEFFTFIISSAQFGEPKPSRALFRHAYERARALLPQLQPRDCFYVGDHYEKDVLGARAAGLSPIWLLRDARDLASGDTHSATDPVPRLHSLRDLLPLLS